MKSPRILMVSQRLYPYVAGAEIQAFGLARALAASGARVRIVTTRLVAGLPDRETLDGVEVRRLPVTPRPLADRSSGAYTAKVSQVAAMSAYVAARARRFDVVHAHCISASAIGAAPALLPVVVGRTGVAEALVEMLGSPERAAALGARARELARPFDFGAVAGRYLDVYREMVRKSP